MHEVGVGLQGLGDLELFQGDVPALLVRDVDDLHRVLLRRGFVYGELHNRRGALSDGLVVQDYELVLTAVHHFDVVARALRS